MSHVPYELCHICLSMNECAVLRMIETFTYE